MNQATNQAKTKTTNRKEQTTMKTTTDKTTKRIETIKQNNERRKEESKNKLLATITNEENIVNKKAVECITILKTTKDKDNEQFTNCLYQLASIIIQSKLKNINKDDKKYREETTQLKSGGKKPKQTFLPGRYTYGQ